VSKMWNKNATRRIGASSTLETATISERSAVVKPLAGKRILVCGKGGSGKSSLTALIAGVLRERQYGVVLVDGDASNPGGLTRLVLGAVTAPKSLIEFFGGREKVTCPVDDPSPLVRLTDLRPVTEVPIDPTEIPSEYSVWMENLVLFQVGKIQKACEGCDGPMSKVTRDFIVGGPYVTVIDVEAGVEHFGRGLERNVDIILIIIDPSFESFEIAARVADLSRMMGIKTVWAILNNVPSQETEMSMQTALHERGVKILGSVRHDPEVHKAGLEGTAIGSCGAKDDVEVCMVDLEATLPASVPNS
jgi:CO dehydrogenase maturation factor